LIGPGPFLCVKIVTKGRRRRFTTGEAIALR
jgi:hypothetical protein